ncbi:MAG TPA: hypothetical protein VKR26_04890, partial [Terriglobales bacterium]|nr:hypothetical protein [Terriglobales bacterium]
PHRWKRRRPQKRFREARAQTAAQALSSGAGEDSGGTAGALGEVQIEAIEVAPQLANLRLD